MSMREIQASEAKAKLAELLTAVEQGETVLITRHGRGIARLVPEAGFRRAEVARAIEELLSCSEGVKTIPLDEALAARHEGHKY